MTKAKQTTDKTFTFSDQTLKSWLHQVDTIRDYLREAFTEIGSTNEAEAINCVYKALQKADSLTDQLHQEVYGANPS